MLPCWFQTRNITASIDPRNKTLQSTKEARYNFPSVYNSTSINFNATEKTWDAVWVGIVLEILVLIELADGKNEVAICEAPNSEQTPGLCCSV